MKIYLQLDKIYKKLKSFMFVADLKLKGGSAPWKTRVEGRLASGDLSELKLGANVVIGKNVKFNMPNGRIVIGHNCVIASNTRLDALGGEIEIGKGVLINSHTIITSWRKVRIGDDTLIAPFCHITDRVHGIGKEACVNEQIGEMQPIEIGCDVWIASSCVVLKGVTVGDGAIIGANSVVNKDVISCSIVAGSPASLIGVRE